MPDDDSFTAEEKANAVLRLFKSESVEDVSRALNVEWQTVENWHDLFVDAGMAALEPVRSQRPSAMPQFLDDRLERLRDDRIVATLMADAMQELIANERASVPAVKRIEIIRNAASRVASKHCIDVGDRRLGQAAQILSQRLAADSMG